MLMDLNVWLNWETEEVLQACVPVDELICSLAFIFCIWNRSVMNFLALRTIDSFL